MTAKQSLLFSWKNVDNLPDLNRFKLALDNLPDDELIAKLTAMRGNGRDDYPVEAMWRLVVAGIVFGHASMASLLREANRNPRLLEICGFEALPHQEKPVYSLVRDTKTGRLQPKVQCGKFHSTIPNSWNMSRFQDLLMKCDSEYGLVSELIRKMRGELMDEVEDYGRYIGYDGKAIKSFSSGRKKRESGCTSDADANWGRHEHRYTDRKSGRTHTKIKQWFGYRLHMIGDVHYEMPIAAVVTPASRGEVPTLNKQLTELFEQTPELAQRARSFCADRGLDSGPLRARLFDEYNILPVIDNRKLWREEKKAINYDAKDKVTRPLYPERADNISYDEAGRVYCHVPYHQNQDISDKPARMQQMIYYGYDKQRCSIKFRCPAAVGEYSCEGKSACLKNANSKAYQYGRTVRINLKNKSRRIFKSVIKGSRTWNKQYAKRSALERIFARVDQGYQMDRHYIRGLKRMQLRCNLIVAIMMSMGLGHVRAGRHAKMRSLIQPVEWFDTG